MRQYHSDNYYDCDACFPIKKQGGIKMCHIQDEGSFIDPNIKSNKEVFEDDYEDGCYIDYGDFHAKMYNQVRIFDSGATRDQDDEKIDFEGFLSPTVLEEFGKYMLKHQTQTNGELRSSDNWQKGMPRDVYMKSAWRHFHDWWMEHRGYESREGVKDALNGLLFNIMGYMYELLKEERNKNELK